MQGQSPVCGVVMGSDSDLPLVKVALDTLEEFGIPYEARVISAHRAPDAVAQWARSARDRGMRVIIAAAGGAAHLPGVVAAHTTLPVIGLPVKGRALEGMDALFSIVQMPPGVPVATVGIDAARNAALLAAQVLAVDSSSFGQLLAQRLEAFKRRMAEEVLNKDHRLRELGAHGYLGASVAAAEKGRGS